VEEKSMSYNMGPHSGSAWLVSIAILLGLGLFIPEVFGLVLGIGGFICVSYLIFKVIGGEGGFFK
jgi:hypothetical protein